MGTNKNKKTKKPSTLSTGRPPTIKRPQATVSSQLTRKTIRSFHALNKRLAKARADGDTALAERLQNEIEALGGLKGYQQASIQGQALDRGGDTSAVLVRWLAQYAKDNVLRNGLEVNASETEAQTKPNSKTRRLRMLEIGALSTRNACSRSGLFEEVVRIDLNSQDEGIEQQDFMLRPLPKCDEERFDVVSLSLVLNFVPDAEGRGEMLKRTGEFLRSSKKGREGNGGDASEDEGQSGEGMFPALFLVLPAPCTRSSRYFNEERLRAIMGSLGYVLLERKETAKLVYSLWHLRQRPAGKKQDFGKVLLNDGKARNNFCVVLR